MSEPNLLAVYVRTAKGDAELATPANGLSINQRKLLQWIDSQITVERLAERLAAGQAVDMSRVVRDIEKLESLTLISPIGAGVSAAVVAAAAASFGAKKRPWALIGVVVLVVIGGVVAFLSQQAPVPKPAQTAAGGQVAETQQEEPEGQIFGVMPNPARWFSPGAKPEQKPVETKPAPLVPPKAADSKVATAATAKATPAPAAPVVGAAPAVQPTPVPVVEAPKPEPVAPPPVVVAQAPKVEAPVPNRKPVYREQPEFPVEASREGITTGSVKARMTVNEAGSVVKVDILDSRPRRVFDRAVRAALSKWRYAQSGATFTVDTEIEFKDN